MQYLYHMLRGYVKVRVHGYSPERFFNLCKNGGLEVWGICCDRDGCTFYMQARQFLKSRPFIRKAGVRLSVEKKLGLPFFMYRNRHRKMYGAGVCAFFLLLYSLSLFIWNIHFDGNRMYSSQTLLEFLNRQGIDYGMMKSRVYCEGIEEAIRTEFQEITWVSAQVSGTRLLIHVKENEVLSSIPQKDTGPCEIVASAPGIVRKMVVRRGVPLVSVGDTVEEGQVLVSGVLEIVDDGGNVVNRHGIHADADILGETVHTEDAFFPLWHPVTYDTGKSNHGFGVRIGPWSFTALLPRNKEESWSYTVEQRQLKLLDDFYLPVYGKLILGRQKVTYERMYGEEERDGQAGRIHQRFLEGLAGRGAQVLEHEMEIQKEGLNWKVSSRARTLEPIGSFRPITQPESPAAPEENPSP